MHSQLFLYFFYVKIKNCTFFICICSMIEFKSVSKSYIKNDTIINALQDINITFSEGNIIGLVGSSGAGKSTLLRMINLLEKPTEGHVIVHDQDLLKLPNTELNKKRQKIGMIFQHFNLLSSKTVYDNIALSLDIARHKDKEEAHQKISELLDIVDLTDKAYSYPSELSGGQKQRVAIARALVNAPDILLCDEATSALDPKTTEGILQLLRDINEHFKITVVLVTHEIDVLQKICDEAVLLDKGQIVEANNIEAFFTQPKTDKLKKFLQAAYHLELPAIYRNKLAENLIEANRTIFKITFFDYNATKPIIANAIREMDLDINIICGAMRSIKELIIGELFIEINTIDDTMVHQVSQFFQNFNIKIERIGCVS